MADVGIARVTALSHIAPLRIELGWPHKDLSPNSRAHRMAKWRASKDAKEEAGWATKAAIGRSRFEYPDERIPVRIIAHPPMAWRTGDDDNLASSAKPHFDAIAIALGVNDRRFEQGGVTWAERRDPPKMIVVIGA